MTNEKINKKSVAARAMERAQNPDTQPQYVQAVNQENPVDGTAPAPTAAATAQPATPPVTDQKIPDIVLNELPELPELPESEIEYPIEEPEAPSEVSEESKSDIDEIDDENTEVELKQLKGSPADNFKKMRTKLAATKKTVKTLDEQVIQLTQKINEYETGLVTPKEYEELRTRITQLEPFEKIHNLKQSPAYIEKVTAPLQEHAKQLEKLTLDNGGDIEVVRQALNADNKSEQNRILLKTLDPVAAAEAKAIIKDMQTIHASAKEMETNADMSVSELYESNQKARDAKITSQRSAIASTSKEAWIQSCKTLSSEGRYPHLTMQAGNTEYNNTVVRPILNKAATEYGRIVTALGQHGLETLPPEVAGALARMTTLAHGAAATNAMLAKVTQELQELKASVQKRNQFARPGSQGSASPSGGAPAPSNLTPAQRAFNRGNKLG